MKGWKQREPKNIHILSKGAQSCSLVAWESRVPNKYGTYPAIAIYPNIGGGTNVGFYGTGGNKIKCFKSYKDAYEFAIKWIKAHPRG